ncbi:hypothetical protein [Streptomyces sp. NPDC002644]
MTALATVDDLEARMGVTFGPDESRIAETCLDDVSALARLYGFPSWGVGDHGIPDAVKAVVLAVAERRMRNPEGYVQEMAGEYSYRLPESGAAGMFFRPDELRVIRQSSGRTGLTSINVARPYRIDKLRYYPHGKDYRSGDY